MHLKIIVPCGCSILLECGHRLFLQLLQEAAKVTCCVTVVCRCGTVSAMVTRSESGLKYSLLLAACTRRESFGSILGRNAFPGYQALDSHYAHCTF